MSERSDVPAARTGRPASRRLVWGVTLLTAFLAPLVVATPAAAHSDLLSATPESDGVVEEMPGEIELVFREDLTPPMAEGDGTTDIAIFDASCEDAGLLIADPGRADTRECRDYADGNVVVEGPTATQAVDVEGAPAGEYTVVWRVLYSDGHVGSDLFTFDAQLQEATTPAPSATPTVVPEPSEEPQQTDEPSTPSPAPAQTTAADDETEADAGDVNEGLSTAAIVGIVAGAVVLVLLIVIITLIVRARRRN